MPNTENIRKDLRNRMDKDGYIEETVPVQLSDIINKNLEEFLDYLSDSMTGTPLLMDIDYDVIGICRDNTILLRVRGNVGNILSTPEEDRRFDAAFIEKELLDGLNKSDCEKLFDLLNKPETYPLEIFNPSGESSAMGFITKHAAETMDYEYDELKEFVGKILGDMNLESENNGYEMDGLTIYLTR